MLRSFAPALLASVLLLAPAAHLPASEVRGKAALAARDIKRILSDEKQREVAIKELSGPASPKTSSGPLFQLALIDELKKLKVGISDEAFVTLGGEYLILDDPKKKDELIVRLILILRDKTAKKLGEVSFDIGARGNDDLPKITAGSVDLEKIPKADREGRNKAMRKIFDNPTLTIDGTRIKASATSSFAVEVLTRPAGGGALKLLEPTADRGQGVVVVKKGDEYVLRLHNSCKHEVAASVTIDGVDAFEFFEPASNRPSRFLIPPGESRLIEGWGRSTEKVSAFLVGSFADSPAARVLKSSSRVGTITVCFHVSWKKGSPPPPDLEGSREVTPDATVQGRDIKKKSEVVERTIGPLAAAVSLRYSK